MYRQPFYKVEEFWFGIAIGLGIVAVGAALFFSRAWALRRIRFNLAKRVSTNFMVAGEIFRLLRLPHGSEAHLTAEGLARLTAGIESHARFFADLLQDEQSFCLFFGYVFAWAFDDVRQIYRDFVEGCTQLRHYLSAQGAEETSFPVEMEKYLRVITRSSDLMSDMIYFKLSRAMGVIDTACRPILDQHAGKSSTKTSEAEFPRMGTVLAEPA